MAYLLERLLKTYLKSISLVLPVIVQVLFILTALAFSYFSPLRLHGSMSVFNILCSLFFLSLDSLFYSTKRLRKEGYSFYPQRSIGDDLVLVFNILTTVFNGVFFVAIPLVSLYVYSSVTYVIILMFLLGVARLLTYYVVRESYLHVTEAMVWGLRKRGSSNEKI